MQSISSGEVNSGGPPSSDYEGTLQTPFQFEVLPGPGETDGEIGYIILISQYVTLGIGSDGQGNVAVSESVFSSLQQTVIFSVHQSGVNYDVNSGKVETTVLAPIGSIINVSATLSTSAVGPTTASGVLDLTVTGPTSSNIPLVTVSDVGLGAPVAARPKGREQSIDITFSGALNADEADNVGTYRLIAAGRRGSFTAKNAKTITIASASYNPETNTVVLRIRKPFSLTKPLQLTIYGSGKSGLQDAEGRLIDGMGHGQPGSNAVFVSTSAGFD
jgi:hypothetical protein